MKNMKKKFFTTAAAILLIFSAAGLAGCGEDETPAPQIIRVGEEFYAENAALSYSKIFTPAGSRFTVKLHFENRGEIRYAKASLAVYAGGERIGSFEADLGEIEKGNCELSVIFSANKDTASKADRIVLAGISVYLP